MFILVVSDPGQQRFLIFSMFTALEFNGNEHLSRDNRPDISSGVASVRYFCENWKGNPTRLYRCNLNINYDNNQSREPGSVDYFVVLMKRCRRWLADVGISRCLSSSSVSSSFKWATLSWRCIYCIIQTSSYGPFDLIDFSLLLSSYCQSCVNAKQARSMRLCMDQCSRISNFHYRMASFHIVQSVPSAGSPLLFPFDHDKQD